MKEKNGVAKVAGASITAKENKKGEIDIEVIDSGELTISKGKEENSKEQDNLIV